MDYILIVYGNPNNVCENWVGCSIDVIEFQAENMTAAKKVVEDIFMKEDEKWKETLLSECEDEAKGFGSYDIRHLDSYKIVEVGQQVSNDFEEFRFEIRKGIQEEKERKKEEKERKELARLKAKYEGDNA